MGRAYSPSGTLRMYDTQLFPTPILTTYPYLIPSTIALHFLRHAQDERIPAGGSNETRICFLEKMSFKSEMRIKGTRNSGLLTRVQGGASLPKGYEGGGGGKKVPDRNTPAGESGFLGMTSPPTDRQQGWAAPAVPHPPGSGTALHKYGRRGRSPLEAGRVCPAPPAVLCP